MNSFYLYFFKQYKNIWKSLSLRIRIEILILFIIYFSFFTTRLIILINDQLNNPNTTEMGLLQFVLHSLIFLISISIPFIHLNLIPKQPGIVYFQTLALNKWNTFWLLFFLHFKYQMIGLIIILPLIVAFLVSMNVFYFIYFFLGIILFQIIFIIAISVFSSKSNSKISIIAKYYILILISFLSFYLLYFFTNYYYWFDSIFFIISLIFIIPDWKRNFSGWDFFIKTSQKKYRQKGIKFELFSYPVFRKIPFTRITPLLAKEMLNYFRNRKYFRIQIISFLLYLLFIIILITKFQEDFILYTAALTILYIWQHFSLQFNEKYIKPERAEFIKTLPIKYYQIWIAKFVSEILFVLILLLILSVFYLIAGYQFADIYQSLLLILLFSLIVLVTIINFRIIFFDRPRFAGYAYHFFIIFITVMSINYYLVGPIIAFTLLIYFSYYSYREFTR